MGEKTDLTGSEQRSRAMLRMLEEIDVECRLTAGLTGIYALQAKTIEALSAVPREAFVPAELRSRAYANTALPIACGQTISQPFIVALMSELLLPRRDSVVLEIGTGSGYQAAVLSRLVKEVYSLEVIPELAEAAANRLQRLGFANISVIQGDGSLGLPARQPFDGIMVTAAASRIPSALREQLSPGARLVIPVGTPGRQQDLQLVERLYGGGFQTRSILPVVFVPLMEPAGARVSGAHG